MFTVCLVNRVLKTQTSVHHHFTQHHVEQLPPSVGDAGRLDVDVAALERLGAVEVEAGVEERGVLPGDDAALLLLGEALVVQLRHVRHVHRQTVQVVHVVSVRGDLV